jgi:hypothetical protein
MATPLKAKSTYVFGVVTRGGDETNLVFIPEPEARRLAAIHQAICRSKTWSDFTRQMPEDDLQEVVSRFIEDDEPLPSDEDRFVVDFLPPAFFDGDWPDWAEQKMLHWVPSAILRKYGIMMPTAINGSYPILDPSRKLEIVAAMNEAGFECREDEELVKGACRQ